MFKRFQLNTVIFYTHKGESRCLTTSCFITVIRAVIETITSVTLKHTLKIGTSELTTAAGCDC